MGVFLFRVDALVIGSAWGWPCSSGSSAPTSPRVGPSGFAWSTPCGTCRGFRGDVGEVHHADARHCRPAARRPERLPSQRPEPRHGRPHGRASAEPALHASDAPHADEAPADDAAAGSACDAGPWRNPRPHPRARQSDRGCGGVPERRGAGSDHAGRPAPEPVRHASPATHQQPRRRRLGLRSSSRSACRSSWATSAVLACAKPWRKPRR